MKFTKGLLLGGLITTSLLMMYNEDMINTNRMMKKGKKFAKKMGIM